MTVSLPPGVSVTRRQFAPSVALSPDGRTLLIAGTGEDGQRLYERRLGSLEAVPVRGTEGGSNPFFSPDGQWIGFFADGSLRRAPGAATHIAAVPGSVFAANPTWGSDNRIVFATGANSPLWSATAFRRDEVERLTTLGTDELSHHFPELLPDGRTLLFVSDGTIHAFDLVGETRVPDFAVEGSAPRYIDQTGHLVLLRGAALLAAPFDAARLELTGEPLPVVEGIASGLYDSQYAISPTGTLAYVSRPAAYELVLRQPDGTERLLMPEHWFSESPRFSPDERRVAVASSRRRDEVQNIWIHDLDTGAEPWPLTTEGGRTPVWGPDGSVTFSRADGTVELRGIYQQSADGLGDPERLLAHEEFLWVIGWTPDGTLAYGTMEPASNIGGSVSSLMAFRDGVPSRVLGPGPLWGGRLSPDGRLLAYYSLDEGRFEVYVTPFPDARRRWPIAEGIDPSWAPGGAEIYYRSGNRLMAARIDRAGPDGPVTVRDRLPVLEPFLPPGYDDYHVDRDGRLVYVRPYPDAQGREVVVVQNWFTELRRRAPAR
jgi:serine/threonine-protein kinase